MVSVFTPRLEKPPCPELLHWKQQYTAPGKETQCTAASVRPAPYWWTDAYSKTTQGKAAITALFIEPAVVPFLCLPPLPGLSPQHPIPHARRFAQSNKIRQRHIALKIKGKSQHFDAFLVYPLAFDQVGDFDLEAFGHFPAYTAGEGDDMRGQQAFQERALLGDADHRPEHVVVFRVESFPFVDAVGDGVFKHGQPVLFHVQARDAHLVVFVADAQSPVGLTEKTVRFFHALVEAEHHGSVDTVMRVQLVLYQGIALVVAAGFIVVVVEPLVFQAYFSGDGTAEARQFPGVEVGVEGDAKDSELTHLERIRFIFWTN